MFAAGRVVTGIGGAGMRSLVSSLIVRKCRDHGSDSGLHAATGRALCTWNIISNVGRFGTITRHCRMAVLAQV